MPGTKWGQRWGDPWGRSELRVTKLRAARALDEPTALELSWDSALEDKGVWHQVYRDGLRVATTREKHLATSGLPGEEHLFEVLDVGPLSGEAAYDLAWALAAAPGNKAKIEWSRVNDAAAYAIYWDSGGGTVDFNSAYVVRADDGAAQQSWTTPELAAGSYKFCVRSRDAAGNESSNTAAQEVAISPWPRPAAGLTVSYDRATGKATLSWSDPPGTFSKVRVYQGDETIAHAYGETDDAIGTWPEVDYASAVAEIDTGVEEWLSPVLSGAGIWVWGLRVYDGTNEEKTADVRVRLELDDSDYDHTARAPRPVELSAAPVADGRVRVRGRIPVGGDAEPTAAVVWRATSSGGVWSGTHVETTVVRAGAYWEFDWTSPVLSDGIEYFFGAKAMTEVDLPGGTTEVFSPKSEAVSATADSTVPSAPGDQSATAVRGE